MRIQVQSVFYIVKLLLTTTSIAEEGRQRQTGIVRAIADMIQSRSSSIG